MKVGMLQTYISVGRKCMDQLQHECMQLLYIVEKFEQNGAERHFHQCKDIKGWFCELFIPVSLYC